MPVDKSSVVLTMLLAVIFLGENISVFGGIGIAAIAAGTFLMIEKKEAPLKAGRPEKRLWLF